MANVFNLQRHTFTDISTGGELYEPTGERVCSILEDRDRGLIQGEEETYKNKVYGETAIPYGFYEIKYLDSPHFKRKMPYLLKCFHSILISNSQNTCIQTRVMQIPSKYCIQHTSALELFQTSFIHTSFTTMEKKLPMSFLHV